MGPYLFNGRLTDPGVDVVSFYADQFPENDMTRDVAHRCAVPLFDSIDGALCLGGRELAVDGVLLIGEHGDYPMNELGQRMYPRKEFFDRIVAVMRRSNRFVPIFNDKHLSYRWDWAKEMYDTARELGIPMMAGSSVPLAQRRPSMETPVGAELTEAVSIHGGPMESYDFHGLEVLQSIVEFRHGGERGVTQVQLLSGDEMLRAARAGQWSVALAETAMRAELGDQFHSLEDDPTRLQHGILLKYADGLRGAILAVGSNANRWNFACQVRAEPATRATAFFAGPWGNRNLFRALSHAIQHMLVTGQPAYPVERTLLTTGVLEASMRSHHQGNVPIETPHLELAYEPIDFAAMREMGASWKILTEDVPMPPVFEPGDKQTLQRARR